MSPVRQAIIIFAVSCSLFAEDNLSAAVDSSNSMRIPDSADAYITVPDSLKEFDRPLTQPAKYSPFAAGGLSALLPGAGQVYCSYKDDRRRKRVQWIKGGLFLAANGIAAGVVVNSAFSYLSYNSVLEDTAWVINYNRMVFQAATDSIQKATFENLFYLSSLHYDLLRYDRRQARYRMYQAIGWNTGLYLFNIMNAIGGSGHFYSSEKKKPVVAALLSAIPALGLGQMYNGSISKAGMIWMVQTMLLDMAFNYNRLMEDCIKQLEMFADTANWRNDYQATTTTNYEKEWDGRYNSAFTNRNLYRWYAIFFYLYGVFDAAVDAHLHDYDLKIRMEPAFNIATEQIGLSFHYEF